MRLLVVSFGLYLVFATSQSACSADPSQNKMCEAYVLTEYVIHSLILLGKTGTHRAGRQAARRAARW